MNAKAQLSAVQVMQTKLEDLEKYAFCDPASGKQQHLRKLRARQAIVVIGVDYLMRIFVLYAWSGKLLASKLRDKILDSYERWQPRRFGIESNAMQELFGDLVITEGKKRFGHTRIIGVPSSTKITKEFKIRNTIEPIANEGRLFVSSKSVELRSEIFGFPTALYKDMIDCLSMAILLVPRRPLGMQRSTEADELAQYLRNTGAPAWYIERRVSEVRHETVH